MNGRLTSAIALALLAASSSALSQGTMTWSYGYDAAGNPTSIVDPNSNQTTFTYDTLQRRKSIVKPAPVLYGSMPRIGISYDGANNVIGVQDPRYLTTSYTKDGLGNVKAQMSPDSGTTNATYDTAGNMLSRTDARGKTVQYSYDVLNRLISVSYPTGAGTTFEYDGGGAPYLGSVGKLTKMTDESGITSFTYDALGHLTGRTQTIDSQSIVTLYGWGSSGSSNDQIVSITYPSGAVVSYGYDAAGRVQSVSASGTTILSGVTYNADNNVTGWQWGNGTAYQRTYDGYGRLSSYPLANVVRTLSYDAAGRITAFSHPDITLNQSFSYDGLDELIKHTTATTTYGYGYDLTGNRNATKVGTLSLINVVSPSSNQLTSVQRVVGAGAVAYAQTYDAAGNLAADGASGLIYSDRGRLTSSATSGGAAGYRYNGLEQRVSKASALVSSGMAYFAYGTSSETLGEYDSSLNVIAETVYLGSTPVAVMKQVGPKVGATAQLSINNVYPDHIDTPRVVTTNSDGSILWRWDTTEAFGSSMPQENPSGLGVFKYDQRMPGQIYDPETGTFYNVNRDYRPGTGSYEQSDPIGLGGGINTYAYVRGNPLLYVDPEGKNLALGGVIVVGGIIYGGYKLYQKFAKFENNNQVCKLQCENVVSCGNPERTGQYQDNAPRCITTCKSYSFISDFFGVGKGPTGPKSPDPTPNYFTPIPPASGRP